jgi:hypothetical protein
MQPTWWESVLFLCPLPIIAAVVAYFIWRPRRVGVVSNSAEPFGSALAQSIASHLKQGLQIRFSHKEYCGLGLRYAENFFIYGEVRDGELVTPSNFSYENEKWPGRSAGERIQMESESDFVDWLAKQSNDSLSGDGNQRLTLERLTKALRYCIEHPTLDWPKYVG